VNDPAGAAISSRPTTSLASACSAARRSRSSAMNQPAMRSNRGHQKAITPGRSPNGSKAARPKSTSRVNASSGSAPSNAETKLSNASWMIVPRSAAPGSASIGSSGRSLSMRWA
jgi:hypothetical protein